MEGGNNTPSTKTEPKAGSMEEATAKLPSLVERLRSIEGGLTEETEETGALKNQLSAAASRLARFIPKEKK